MNLLEIRGFMVNKLSDNSQPYPNRVDQTNEKQPIQSPIEQSPIKQIGRETLLSSPSTSQIPTPPSLEKMTQLSTEYWTLTRRIPKDRLVEINQTINALPDKEIRISQLLTALKENNWKHEIFQDENYPLYALEAVKEKRLSSIEFSTLMFYWTAHRNHAVTPDQLEVIPIFVDGKPNPQAVQMLKETMKSYEPGIAVFKSNTEFLTDTQFEELIRQMAKAPASEQQFFLVPQKEDYTIFNAIQVNKINVFGDVASTTKRMIPSLTLMQRFLDIKFGPQAVQINPVIGLSLFKDIIANGAGGQRDMAIPFPGIDLPKDADNIFAPGFDFSYHDFYHAFIVSSIPQEHRQALVKSAFISIDAINDSNTKAKSYYSKVIDMEATAFRNDRLWPRTTPPNEEEKVWINLLETTINSSVFTFVSDSLFDSFFNVLIHAIQHREEWKGEFGLKIDLGSIKFLGLKYFVSNSLQVLIPVWEKAFKSLEASETIQILFQQNKIKELEKYIDSLSKDSSFNFTSKFFAGFTDSEALRKAIEYTTKNRFLREADFSGCKILDDSHIESLIQVGYNGGLNVSGCTKLTGEIFKSLKKLTFLYKLDISGCPQLLNCLHNLPAGLSSLNLSGVKGLTDQHVAIIAKTCPNLMYITLNRSPLITDEAVAHLSAIPSLKHVELSQCTKLTGEGLYSLAFQPNISYIDVENCPKISKETIDKINEERELKLPDSHLYINK